MLVKELVFINSRYIARKCNKNYLTTTSQAILRDFTCLLGAAILTNNSFVVTRAEPYISIACMISSQVLFVPSLVIFGLVLEGSLQESF